MKVLGRLLLGRGNRYCRAIYRRVCGGGGAIRVLSTLAYGLAQVGREVEDELAVYDHVVVGLLQIAGKHFCE